MADLLQQMQSARTEADVKNRFQDYFAFPPESTSFDWVDMATPHIFFEVKHAPTNIYKMLAQLLLTIHQRIDKIDTLPEYIGGFDCEKCAIVPFDELYQELESYNDIDWSQTPSSVDEKTTRLVESMLRGKERVFYYKDDERELRNTLNKIQKSGKIVPKKITINNFASVFQKWNKELGNNICCLGDWDKNSGILLGDFYLADLMSANNVSVAELEKLKILRDGNKYRSNVKINGELFTREYKIQNPDKHNAFWNRYRRPPKREYWGRILERRDLLVPQQVREIKGAFFTPQIWVEKSQEYMARTFGDEFADMYIWDCAAGTGNLLVGLPQNPRNIFASTLDVPDVEIMKQNGNLFENQVFQFDFLNDEFNPVRVGGKIPDRLYDIITSEQERKKLIIYINPPYSEPANNKKIASKNGKSGLKKTKISEKYDCFLSHAKKELFAQFLMRIYQEIPDCIIAEFSTLKTIQAPRFNVFRQYFLALLKSCFVVPADTFDNVKGQFPIGFKIWDTSVKKKISNVSVDILDRNGDYIGQKKYYSYDNMKFINDWAKIFRAYFNVKGSIATIVGIANDFQQQNLTFITKPYKKVIASNHNFQIINSNLIESAIYFAVRHAIPANWLNDRDQFLFPTAKPVNGADNLLEARSEFLYDRDDDFKNDCLIFTLFHNQNRISSSDGINHWIPFSESMVGCRSAFDSNFMFEFLSNRNIPKYLTIKARAVYDAGLELWQYYHTYGANPNVSLYDIKEFFKGRNNKGKINNKSDDETFNKLAENLSGAMRALAKQITPKIYEYGFLRQ